MAQEDTGPQTSGLKLDAGTALTLGFGLHNAWVCSFLYSVNTPFERMFSIAGINGSTVTPFYIISAIAFGLTALIVAMFDQQLVRFSRSRKFMALAALITCLGSLAVLIPVQSFAEAAVFDSFIGIATGFGSSLLAIFWGIAFARENAGVIAIAGSTAYALGYVLNAIVLQMIPTPANQIIVAAIPLIEFALLAAISPKPLASNSDYIPFNGLPTSKTKLAGRLLVPLVLIGFALGVLKALSVQATFGANVDPSLFVMLFLAGSLSVALFALYPLIKGSIKWDFFLRIMVPVVACAALVGALFVMGSEEYSSLLLLVAYILIESLLWISYAYVSHACRLSPIFTIGSSRGIITFAMLVGVLAPAATSDALARMPGGEASLVAIAIACIALGYVLMPSEPNLVKMIAPCPAVRMVSLDIDENMHVFAAAQSSTTAAEIATPQAGTQTKTATPVAPGPAATATVAEKQPLSEARAAMLGVQPTEKASGGKFSHKVKKVAETYLLTERETDILFELAKGNSPKYIEGKYYISAGTVKTHIRNIYHKLNVHKRDELIRLIESADDFD